MEASMRHVVGRLVVSGAALGFVGFLSGGVALADCPVPLPGVPAPPPTPQCVSLLSVTQNAPVQEHFPASPLAIPDTNAVAGTVDSSLNQVYRAVAGTTAASAPNPGSRTGTSSSGNAGTAADSAASASGGAPTDGGAGGSGAGADPAAGTSVLGARVEAPVLPTAGSDAMLSMTAPTGATPPQVKTLIAPAAEGMNGPAGLSALIIVIATATVAGAGVAQARVMQARRAGA
ncbi:MAG: hypothetical protein NVSMB13_06660 [Mycobacteriales bacterium]